jgi:hypothetical protein
VGSLLESYASRRVVRGFSRELLDEKSKTVFRVRWHRDRLFEFIVDTKKNTITIPLVLPNVPARSEMYRAFKKFLRRFHSDSVPMHRRIDARKVRIRSVNKAGDVSLCVLIQDGDYAYGLRKLVHIVQEIYLGFLYDGPYREYMTEAFGLEPDFV